jgi:NAD(P)H-dependent flavin oxidoreductase YrpB (nitropropane dioxygenase family)
MIEASVGPMTSTESPLRGRLEESDAGPYLPSIIQGGMGVGVSGWQLARAVSLAGQLGVVSGVALDTVMARRLQAGDPNGDARRALEHFPVPAIAEQIVDRHFVAGGIGRNRPFRLVRRLRLGQRPIDVATTVAGNFVEIFLAKEGHAGKIGVNYLEKLQMATPAAVLGAMLAGVDYVLMGAGIPAEIPQLLDDLAACRRGGVRVDVEGASGDADYKVAVDPTDFLSSGTGLERPRFVAVIASHVLAQFLARDPVTRPDGFVAEMSVAGGHSAPPRGRMVLDEDGEPVYGARDLLDTDAMAAIGLPFWLAGGYGSPEGLKLARDLGAAGIQAGSAFALCAESGIRPELRKYLVDAAKSGGLRVRNDPVASSTGYPFKVADVPGTVSDAAIYGDRKRLCDLGYLRVPYVTPGGDFRYRCASEPVAAFVGKGGKQDAADGRRCLCNGLLATVGLAQRRPDGYVEPSLVTLGKDLSFLAELAGGADEYPARDVVAYLLSL